jgi:ABC-type transport system substrate-binding protein
MFARKKWAGLFALLIVSSLILAACATPTPETIIETVVETKVVEVEKEVTKIVEGETIVETVVETKVVKEEVEVVVTATPEPEPTKPPKKELEGLWYPISTEPPTLDIQLATDTTSHLIIHQCIEGLFEYRGDGSIEPSGATDYSVSDDGLVYTINLREDAVWSDGVPVTAQQYVDGVVRLMKPETAAEYAWLMYDIEGAEEFNTG